MAKICPECGREFSPMSQSIRCPICKCVLVDNEGIDNSEAARKERLRQLQTQRVAQAQARSQAQIHTTQTKGNTKGNGEKEKKKFKTTTLVALILCGIVIGAALGSADHRKEDNSVQTTPNAYVAQENMKHPSGTDDLVGTVETQGLTESYGTDN